VDDAFVADALSGREPAPDPPVIDEAAFEILYRRTAGDLRSYVARVMGQTTYADDIVQESYLRLVRSPPPTSDLQELRAWLFRIASRLVIDQWRRMKRDRKRDSTAAPPQETRGPDVPLRVDMARVFEQLSPQQRQLMWLAYVEGHDHREIAATLSLREPSVRVLLHRAKRKLARLFGERGSSSR